MVSGKQNKPQLKVAVSKNSLRPRKREQGRQRGNCRKLETFIHKVMGGFCGDENAKKQHKDKIGFSVLGRKSRSGYFKLKTCLGFVHFLG